MLPYFGLSIRILTRGEGGCEKAGAVHWLVQSMEVNVEMRQLKYKKNNKREEAKLWVAGKFELALEKKEWVRIRSLEVNKSSTALPQAYTPCCFSMNCIAWLCRDNCCQSPGVCIRGRNSQFVIQLCEKSISLAAAY